jgi:glycosyltransferase involved in cell wall biosynthesis
MVKRILMIAFHFPPLRGSSGIQRTLKFSQYLPQFGWEPLVLSAHPRAYANAGNDQLRDIPDGLVVRRAFALDTSRHLSVRGKYPGFFALPDRWISWLFGAVPAGLRLIWRYRPDVIWSTSPIATAHLIGLALHRLTGIPWVVDMRDPMSDDSYPTDPFIRRLYRRIENKVIRHCNAVVCTTEAAVKAYQARFPELPASRFKLIENGYDEENFADAERDGKHPEQAREQIVMVHSGVIYPSERNPIPLFAALSALQQEGVIAAGKFKLILRATGHDSYLQGLIDQHGIASLVTLAPHLPYREALTEMLNADSLLLLQAANCNHQIPAKLYEYLRARRPILALTDPAGETAAALRTAGIDTIAPLDSKDEIMLALKRFLALIASNSAPLASTETIAANSRHSRTAQLSGLLDAVWDEARATKN